MEYIDLTLNVLDTSGHAMIINLGTNLTHISDEIGLKRQFYFFGELTDIIRKVNSGFAWHNPPDSVRLTRLSQVEYLGYIHRRHFSAD